MEHSGTVYMFLNLLTLTDNISRSSHLSLSFFSLSLSSLSVFIPLSSRASFGGASRRTWCTRVTGRRTASSTRSPGTAASTAGCRNAWKWACPRSVSSSALLYYTTAPCQCANPNLGILHLPVMPSTTLQSEGMTSSKLCTDDRDSPFISVRLGPIWDEMSRYLIEF